MIHRQRQTGYVLILTLLGLMGMGGVVLAGFTQQAKEDLQQQRQVHNQRILEEAKQALLVYAYNYPSDNAGRGPGRLPCPDTNNNGSPNPSFNCINGNPIVGRFPWNDADLNFYDARDASGERLWYAVASTFANQINPPANDVINSDTVGTITLVDQSGNIVYDGTVEGIAAVIIAPGPITSRDNDNNGTYEYLQIRNTDPQRNNPVKHPPVR